MSFLLYFYKPGSLSAQLYCSLVIWYIDNVTQSCYDITLQYILI